MLDHFVIDWYKERPANGRDIDEHIRQCRIWDRREAEVPIIQEAQEPALDRPFNT